MEKSFAKQKNLTATINSLEDKIKDKDEEIENLTKALNQKENFDA